MTRSRLQLGLAAASVALVLTAAAVSRSDRWNFDFAQYKGPERPEPKDEFRFVMVGDRTGRRVPLLMPQAFREINYLYPDFVISVGDLIDGPGPTPERINQLWKEFDDEVSILRNSAGQAAIARIVYSILPSTTAIPAPVATRYLSGRAPSATPSAHGITDASSWRIPEPRWCARVVFTET